MAAYHFCTIASPDFLPFTEALYQSLQKQSTDAQLHVLVADEEQRHRRGNCIFYNLKDIQKEKNATAIIEKYYEENDFLRWALKPSFLKHLLRQHDRIFYCDNDLYFFNDFRFLFDLFDEASLLLSPHWCSFNPFQHNENFPMNFQSGLFNAGFVGVSSEALPFLDWWNEVCLFKMSRQVNEGFFVDQRYLDVSPLLFEKTAIIRHRGCNVGSWNMHENKRLLNSGKVLINGEFPIVFIHFNEETIKHIANGNDGLLKPYLEEFKNAVTNAGGDIYKMKEISALLKSSSPGFKQKLRLRTRLKNWLYYLSQKL